MIHIWRIPGYLGSARLIDGLENIRESSRRKNHVNDANNCFRDK
jgi:hypothetical protein